MSEEKLPENEEVTAQINESPDDDSKGNAIDHGEQYRLGGRPPFQTICRMTIGPLCSQICQSMYGLMDSFWISRTIGQKGMTVMSLILVVDFVNIAFAQFFSVAMSARISYLFGKKKKETCAQVVVDLLRVCMIAGVCIPAILLPAARPLVKWYGADDELADMCMSFLYPSLCCSMINYSWLSLCGLLQAMGNSGLFGICQVTSAVLNMCCFDPLFLVGLKSGMWGASTATVLSYTIPFTVLYACLFCGKFTVKPSFRNYCRKFNKHCFRALKVSFSQLLANMATSLPVLLLAKLTAKAAERAGIYTAAMTGWNLLDRLYIFCICVCNALNQGYLPSASYAYGSGRLNRLLRLAICTLGLGMCWALLCTIILTTLPKQVASIWGSDPLFLETTRRMMIPGFSTVWMNPLIFTLTATLQAMTMVGLSIVTSCLVFLLPIPIFASILYVTKNDDPPRLIWSFVAHDSWGAVVVLIIVAVKMRFLWKEEPSGSSGWFTKKKKSSEEEDLGEIGNDDIHIIDETKDCGMSGSPSVDQVAALLCNT